MSNELLILNKFIYALGSVAGILFLFFRMKDSFQQTTDREATQIWYRKIWVTIENLRITKLPARTIEWVIIRKEKLVKWLGDISEKISDNTIADENPYVNPILVLAVFFIASSVLIYLDNGFKWIYVVYCLLQIGVLIYIYLVKDLTKKGIIAEVISLLLILFLVSTGLFFILSFLIEQNPIISAFFLFILIPVLAIFTNTLLLLFGALVEKIKPNSFKIDYEGLHSFGLATSISFSITMLALFLGSRISPEATFPQNAQLLLINVLFDGLTLAITFVILKWSIKKNVFFRIPIAIVIDLLIAGFFACCSLYLGLFSTEYSVSIEESINILFAKSKDGKSWDLGPYFWAMHTTFIPTLFYLIFISLTIIGKYFTLPFLKFFKGVSAAEKPHYATATTFGFIGALLLAIVKCIEWYYS